MMRVLFRFGFFFLLLFPAQAFAQFWIYCGKLPGCKLGWEDYLRPALDLIVESLPVYAEWLGILFLTVGAFYMLLNLGDEQKIETGKKIVIWSLIGIAIALFAHEFVTMYLDKEDFVDDAAVGEYDIVLAVIQALGRIISTFFSVALLAAILFNAFRMILSRGNDEEFGKAKRGLFWAAVGAVIFTVAARLINAVTAIINEFANQIV